MEKYGGRLGKLVMKELMGILSAPHLLKVGNENVDVELASLISIVQVDMSADNRVAKVLVSAMGADIEKKRASKWLNENTKAIRFALAQRISHLKTTPQLQFIALDSPSGEVLSILDQLRAEREARETQSKGSDTLHQM
jgi:ribosome-binding factor A